MFWSQWLCKWIFSLLKLKQELRVFKFSYIKWQFLILNPIWISWPWRRRFWTRSCGWHAEQRRVEGAQTSHLKGFSPECCSEWTFRDMLRLNDFPHVSQVNGMSFVCANTHMHTNTHSYTLVQFSGGDDNNCRFLLMAAYKRHLRI